MSASASHFRCCLVSLPIIYQTVSCFQGTARVTARAGGYLGLGGRGQSVTGDGLSGIFADDALRNATGVAERATRGFAGFGWGSGKVPLRAREVWLERPAGQMGFLPVEAKQVPAQ